MVAVSDKMAAHVLLGEERASAAIHLRVRGLSWDAIAAEMGYSDGAGPYQLVKRHVERRGSEAVSTLREIEGARLDEVIAAHLPVALDATAKRSQVSARIVLTATAQRCALYGLELRKAPDNVTVNTYAPTLNLGVLSDDELAQFGALMAKAAPQLAKGRTIDVTPTEASETNT